jgi:hypothetical protein
MRGKVTGVDRLGSIVWDRNKPYGLDRRGLGGMNDGRPWQRMNWGLFSSLSVWRCVGGEDGGCEDG